MSGKVTATLVMSSLPIFLQNEVVWLRKDELFTLFFFIGPVAARK